MTAADLDGDGVFDLAVMGHDGGLLRVSSRERGKSWDTGEIARWSAAPADPDPGSVLLVAADLDNNGGLDLLAVGPKGGRIWLNEGPNKFRALPAVIAERVFAVEDLRGSGRLDLLAVDGAGKPVRLVSSSTRDYQSLAVRAENDSLFPSQDIRISSFAIGSEAEVRGGTLIQKQIVRSPRTHFGLGNRKNALVLRMVWTSGYSRSVFEDLDAGKTIKVNQGLRGW